MKQIDNAIKAIKEVIAVKDDIKLKVCGLADKQISSFLFDECFACIEGCVNFLNMFNDKVKS